MPEPYIVKRQKFVERVAAIVGKTSAVMGPRAIDEGYADDEAILKLKDLLNELDPALLEEYKDAPLTNS